MLEGHVRRCNTSHYASTRNFMNEQRKTEKAMRWFSNTNVSCAKNCSVGSYMGWGFPLASHSMIMVSLGSTMCSFIDCFMMVGGCLTAGRETNQLSMEETCVMGQITTCIKLVTHLPEGRPTPKHRAIQVAAALVRPVFPSLQCMDSATLFSTSAPVVRLNEEQ